MVMADLKGDLAGRRKAGLGVILGAAVLLAAGYISLSLGSITVAPAMIIGALVLMAVGIWIGFE
jgi:hypothetical protein